MYIVKGFHLFETTKDVPVSLLLHVEHVEPLERFISVHSQRVIIPFMFLLIRFN